MQILVEQVQLRWRDDAGDHLVGVAEVVLVMTVAGGAVGGDQRRLAGPPGAAGALRVVRGRGRHVAHRHRIQSRDVHTELHRGRAVQQFQLALAEVLFAFFPDLRRHLRGVLARDQTGQGRSDVPVEPDKVVVDARLRGAAERPRQRVVGAVRTVSGRHTIAVARTR